MSHRLRLINGLHNLRPTDFADGCVATIGKYDGVHLGHQAIIRNLMQQAKARDLPAVVVLFEPLPQEYFALTANKPVPARLGNLRENVEVLAGCGVDAVLVLKFDHRFPNWPADAFIQELLVEGLRVSHLIVGDDFRFGAGRLGDFNMLQKAGEAEGFTVADTESVMIDGQRVSSGRVRQALSEHDLALAAQFLGRPYSISGRVAHGDARGRLLGYPTANILLKRRKSALSGVYAVRVHGAGLQAAAAMANLGTRPTVDGSRESLEVHIFDLPKETDLYGQRLQIEFVAWLRAEEKFDSLEALTSQLADDEQAARACLV